MKEIVTPTERRRRRRKVNALALGGVFSIGGAFMQACEPAKPEMSCVIQDRTTHPNNGKCGVWGPPGYYYVSVQCSDQERSPTNPNPAVDAVYDTPWIYFGGGGSSYSPATYGTRYCSYAYPYIMRVDGASSAS